MITLVEIDRHNIGAVLKLKVAPEQESYVANNAVSIAQGSVESASWYRAAVDGEGRFLGFVMLYDPRKRTEPLDEDDPDDGVYIWRLLVAKEAQGMGVGRQIIEKVMDYARERHYPFVYVSAVEGVHGPKAFYQKLGFVETGRFIHNETELKLTV